MAWGVVTALMSTIVMLCWGNYYFGLQNQIEHLPVIMRMVDPDYLTNDWFVNAASGFGPRWYYEMGVAQLAKLVPIPVIFLLLTIAANILVGYVTYQMMHKLKAARLKATMATMLVVGTTGISLGQAAQLKQVSLEPSHLALSLSLFGVYLLFARRDWLALGMLILALMIHPAVAILVTIVTYGAQMKGERTNWWQMLIFGIAGVLLWGKSAMTMLSTTELYRLVAEFRNPHHLLPSRFEPMQYVLFGLLTAGYVWANHRLKQNLLTKQLAKMMGIMYVLLVLGYLLVEIYPVREMIMLQPFRLVALTKWIAIVTLAAVPGGWGVGLAGLLSIANRTDLLTVSLSGLTLAGLWRLKRELWGWAVIGIVLVIGGLVVIDRQEHWEWFAPVRPRLLISDGISPEEEVMDWIKENTPEEAMILTPPSWGEMRLRGERAIVADFKEVPYQEVKLSEWHDRLVDVYGVTKFAGWQAEADWDMRYREMTDERLEQIARKYGASYAVLYCQTKTQLLMAFENECFRVVRFSE